MRWEIWTDGDRIAVHEGRRSGMPRTGEAVRLNGQLWRVLDVCWIDDFSAAQITVEPGA